MLSPKFIRNRNLYLPFIIIWFIFGTVYSILEFGILGDSEIYPATGNIYDPKNNFKFLIPACILMGLFQGYLEIVWLKKKFKHTRLWLKVLIKTLFYLLIIVVFILIVGVINSVLVNKVGPFSAIVYSDLTNFVSEFAFWSIVIYTGLGVFFALLFSEIIDYLGNEVFYNFLFGKYHQPIDEVRIFMFLDMKSSTTIAENIGHQKYFNLIRAYYSDMTNAIVECKGEIYQYVGDEIVISWNAEKGIENNNCIQCLFEIEAALLKRKSYYLETFGIFPTFKAGVHMGSVTTGEIGVLKKDIIYTGDVLNTSARIQAKCNDYDSKCIVSRVLKEALQPDDRLQFSHLGHLSLKGKQIQVELYDLKMDK
ncbi:adenylate/guanylate cyclase domain-containing protein [Winogradskyella tangerina]|uniref:adenylate/guanylate cyclase domain-containing protein n=1 Tax=Winogradskyella tangerina TaxID=2023240 RepID=UPI000DBE06B6|nr:adenylate/guanylate cyclase domain-containing protein [Winogradskyella tangerina]